MGEHGTPEPEDLVDPDKPYSAENPRKSALVSHEGEDVREEAAEAVEEHTEE
jgi:hypothetical protein